MVRVLVSVIGCVPRLIGHSLVTLFFLSMSVKDRPLHWILVRSQTYYFEYILVYGSMEGSLLSYRGFRLFPGQLIGGGNGGSLSTTLSPGLRCGGLESKFGRGPRPLDRRVVGRSCLCLGYKRGVCFGVPSWAHWFAKIAGWSGMTCLQSSTVIRTGSWKMVKWFWLLTTCLKVAQVLT